ncbi:phosphoribosyl transferase [Patescibacteria group bacterium]|nr:MAG: phosphoribosyl transferase [Patescibacteria group bacterium]
MTLKRFTDRAEAGRVLAGLLAPYTKTKTVVYALPRGGVVVGVEVARALEVPLDLVITRKIGHPENPEYAIASVSESGEVLCNPREPSPISESWFDEEVERQKQEAARRRQAYLGDRARISAKGKNAIIVDDGVATGLSLLIAIKEIKRDVPWKTVVAVPVVPADVAEEIKKEADELLAPIIDDHYLGAVGAYYDSFEQVTDDEVAAILKEFVPPSQKTQP